MELPGDARRAVVIEQSGFLTAPGGRRRQLLHGDAPTAGKGAGLPIFASTRPGAAKGWALRRLPRPGPSDPPCGALALRAPAPGRWHALTAGPRRLAGKTLAAQLARRVAARLHLTFRALLVTAPRRLRVGTAVSANPTPPRKRGGVAVRMLANARPPWPALSPLRDRRCHRRCVCPNRHSARVRDCTCPQVGPRSGATGIPAAVPGRSARGMPGIEISAQLVGTARPEARVVLFQKLRYQQPTVPLTFRLQLFPRGHFSEEKN